MSRSDEIKELTDDIEVIGPGQMLREARENLGFSQEQVAEQLNFKSSLVIEIENENFPANVPVTFTRGYLKNYAKLVRIPIDEVLASFEMLGVAKSQYAEMQSFSKQTSKQAENNRIMLMSYFVILTLIGLTVVWWYQNSPNNQESLSNVQLDTPNELDDMNVDTVVVERNDTPPTISQTQLAQDALDELVQAVAEEPISIHEKEQLVPNGTEKVIDTAATNLISLTEQSTEQALESEISLSQVVFTFSGDCWVNIYDSTGERIAWGIKKADYVMNISGIAPFTVTLGKPELVSIEFNKTMVDMSRYPAGNIAKFELPLNE